MTTLQHARAWWHARRRGPRKQWALAGLLSGAVLAGAVPGVPVWAAPPATVGWVTSPYDGARRLVPVERSGAAPTSSVVVTPTERYQTWRGVGGAVTDASVSLLAGNTSAQSALFDSGAATGAHLNLVRLPLSATDFSVTGWTWAWDPATGATPPPEAETAVGLVHALRQRRPDLGVVATAWSAPVAMKSGVLGATLERGSLKRGSERAYGELLVAQAGWLLDHGVPLRAMTLGNEPAVEPTFGTYPRMAMADDQMIPIARAVAPLLAARGIELWAMDHNWEHRSRVDALLDGAPSSFAAAAFTATAHPVPNAWPACPSPRS
jgi:glucosylceramidase